MLDMTLTLLAGAAGVALGAAAAQIGGAISLNWEGRAGDLRQRLNNLPRNAPPASRRMAGVLVLATLLAGGGLVTYAAEPSAPERLAANASGVVGSGNQLTLKVREAGVDRSLKVGDVYAEGWTLKALTPSTVTIARDGATMLVGLNPSGQVLGPAPAGAPSTISVVGLPDEATIQAAIARLGPMAEQGMAQATRLGLSADQARRFLVYRLKIQDETMRKAAAGEAMRPGPPNEAELRALLGEGGFADYSAITAIGNPGAAAQAAADLAARPISGASSYYVPAGADQVQVALAQGIDLRGVWSISTPDALGGVTLTRNAAPIQGPAAGAAPTP